MPIQLNTDTEKLHGEKIDKKMVLEMINYYRANRRKDANSLKFSHFSVQEFLDLFAANGIIPALSTQQQVDVAGYGVKIYMANHAGDQLTCPAGREATYPPYDTTIICNTQITNNTWIDMLVDNENSVSLAGGGSGLDKGSICPPDCPPNPDADGALTSDSSPNP